MRTIETVVRVHKKQLPLRRIHDALPKLVEKVLTQNLEAHEVDPEGVKCQERLKERTSNRNGYRAKKTYNRDG